MHHHLRVIHRRFRVPHGLRFTNRAPAVSSLGHTESKTLCRFYHTEMGEISPHHLRLTLGEVALKSYQIEMGEISPQEEGL